MLGIQAQQAGTGWSARQVAIGVIVVAYLAVHLVIPALQLRLKWETGYAQPFGWQMFSDARDWPEFVVVTSDGKSVSFERGRQLDAVMRVRRSDLDVERFVPPHLCAVVPGAVRVIDRAAEPAKEYPCD